MNAPQKQIPPDRQATYYIGMMLAAIGFLMFFGCIFTGAMSVHQSSPFGPGTVVTDDPAGVTGASSDPSPALAMVGFIFFAIGGILMGIGRRGLAGSGIVLDPEQARKDVEPWARAAGGVVDDALSEVDIAKKIEEKLDNPEQVVKVRCRKCQALNDESAKFCNQCGAEL